MSLPRPATPIRARSMFACSRLTLVWCIQSQLAQSGLSEMVSMLGLTVPPMLLARADEVIK
jgi:hypothetical protein